MADKRADELSEDKDNGFELSSIQDPDLLLVDEPTAKSSKPSNNAIDQ